jgi:hypothetical protein
MLQRCAPFHLEPEEVEKYKSPTDHSTSGTTPSFVAMRLTALLLAFIIMRRIATFDGINSRHGPTPRAAHTGSIRHRIPYATAYVAPTIR